MESEKEKCVVKLLPRRSRLLKLELGTARITGHEHHRCFVAPGPSGRHAWRQWRWWLDRHRLRVTGNGTGGGGRVVGKCDERTQVISRFCWPWTVEDWTRHVAQRGNRRLKLGIAAQESAAR